DGSLFASGLIVDGLRAFDDNLWSACDAVVGFGEPLIEPQMPDIPKEAVAIDKFDHEHAASVHEYQAWKEAHAQWEAKVNWVRRAKQFAVRYFDGDLRRMCYCLKCVHNWKLWCDLQREYVDVDYSQMLEEKDNTEVNREWAC